MLLAIPLLALAGMQVVAQRRFVKRLLNPANVALSIEYRSAKWVEANLPGRRVMLPGSMAAWLNAFVDTPQLCGQSYSTAPNWMQQVAQYAIFSGEGLGERDAEYSILWLKAFGVAAVGVSGPRSPEYWRPFAHPGKFEGVLPVLWREDDTTIYGVPPGSASLAHAIARKVWYATSPSAARIPVRWAATWRLWTTHRRPPPSSGAGRTAPPSARGWNRSR